MCAGKPGGVALAESAGWADVMKLVLRACVVVTEDMPVDPDARDLQVCQCLPVWQVLMSFWKDVTSPQLQIGRKIGHGCVMFLALCGTCSIAAGHC